MAEALENAVDTLDEAIAGYMIDNKTLPESSAAVRNEHIIALPLQTILKHQLRKAVVKLKFSHVDLGRLLKVNEKEVRRIWTLITTRI